MLEALPTVAGMYNELLQHNNMYNLMHSEYYLLCEPV